MDGDGEVGKGAGDEIVGGRQGQDVVRKIEPDSNGTTAWGKHSPAGLPCNHAWTTVRIPRFVGMTGTGGRYNSIAPHLSQSMVPKNRMMEIGCLKQQQ